MAAGSAKRDPTDVFMWRRIDDRLTTSGQPTEPQLEAIEALGVTHVVNLGLHTHERALPDENGAVERLGMTYVHIPVDFDHPTDGDFDCFCQTMDRLKDETVHVHCIANLRVSAFIFRYHRERLGVPEQAARETMERVWRPGGVWGAFIGDGQASASPHRFAGRDY